MVHIVNRDVDPYGKALLDREQIWRLIYSLFFNPRNGFEPPLEEPMAKTLQRILPLINTLQEMDVSSAAAIEACQTYGAACIATRLKTVYESHEYWEGEEIKSSFNLLKALESDSEIHIQNINVGVHGALIRAHWQLMRKGNALGSQKDFLYNHGVYSSVIFMSIFEYVILYCSEDMGS